MHKLVHATTTTTYYSTQIRNALESGTFNSVFIRENETNRKLSKRATEDRERKCFSDGVFTSQEVAVGLTYRKLFKEIRNWKNRNLHSTRETVALHCIESNISILIYGKNCWFWVFVSFISISVLIVAFSTMNTTSFAHIKKCFLSFFYRITCESLRLFEYIHVGVCVCVCVSRDKRNRSFHYLFTWAWPEHELP